MTLCLPTSSTKLVFCWCRFPCFWDCKQNVMTMMPQYTHYFNSGCYMGICISFGRRWKTNNSGENVTHCCWLNSMCRFYAWIHWWLRLVKNHGSVWIISLFSEISVKHFDKLGNRILIVFVLILQSSKNINRMHIIRIVGGGDKKQEAFVQNFSLFHITITLICLIV